MRSALEADDTERIQSTAEALSLALQEIGQAAYGAAGGGTAPAANGDAAPGSDGGDAAPGSDGGDADEGEAASTVEGEFREV